VRDLGFKGSRLRLCGVSKRTVQGLGQTQTCRPPIFSLQKHRTGKDGAEHEAGDKRGGECQDVDGHDYSLTFCNMAKTIMAIASRTVQVITMWQLLTWRLPVPSVHRKSFISLDYIQVNS
jgi:hypothetical protein